jgi:hypothetical protein
MGSLIHADQQCSVQDRNLHNHTHFIRAFITYAYHKDYQSSILSLAQEKSRSMCIYIRVSLLYIERPTYQGSL